jgi:ankyrin repeat protein
VENFLVVEKIGGYKIEKYTSASSQTELMKKLVKAGADVNASNNMGTTALMHMAYKGNLEVLQALIEDNADINAKDNDGNNALMYACLHCKYAAIKSLLEAGINVNERNNGICWHDCCGDVRNFLGT